MNIVRMSTKEFKQKFGYLGRASAVTSFPPNGGQPTVYTRNRINTAARLHEIYHAVYSPRLKGSNGIVPTLQGIALEELEAEEFACKSRGHELRANNAFIAILRLLNLGVKPSRALGTVSRALETMGYYLPDKDKSNFWWDIKGK